MLELIQSSEKKEELSKKLERFSMLTEHERIWLVGFLHYAGYTEPELIDLLVSYGGDRQITAFKVAAILKTSKRESKFSQVGNKPKRILQEIHQKDIAERLALIPDSDPNKELFKDSYCISTGYKHPISYKECHSIKPAMKIYDPKQYSYFCSIQKQNGTLLVLDYDRAHGFGGSLEKCWHHAKKIFLERGGFDFWDWFKFSGSEGFHLIKLFPKKTPEQLRAMASMIDEAELYDPALFQANRRIRGYCMNLKSGLMSMGVTPELTISQILAKAKNCGRCKK